MDLRSIDFQTGRENGEPSYCTVLRIFHGVNASCNAELKKNQFFLHDASTIEFFEKHYKNICDISLSIGADLETRTAAPVGTTNGIFIAEQTHRSMCGDRFYFNNAAFFREGLNVQFLNQMTLNLFSKSLFQIKKIAFETLI